MPMQHSRHLFLQPRLPFVRISREDGYLVRTDIYIRYKILLDINGMVDGPPSGTPVSERLRLLKNYTFQFRNGTDAAARSSALPHWCVTPENEDWAPSLSFASFTSYIIRKPRLNLVEVFCPAIDFLDTPHHWVIPLARNFPGGKVLEVSVDVVQDLLLVFQEEADESQVLVHVRSLQNPEKPHSSAMLSALRAATPHPRSVESIQIHKDRVAWSSRLGSPQDELRAPCWDIEVWNWSSGELVWHSHFHGAISFALLDESRIVAGCCGWDELRMYHVEPETASTDSTSPTSTMGTYFIRLRLPRGTRLERIQESSIPNPPPGVAFFPDPALRMVTVALSDSRPKERYTRVGLLVSYEALRSILSQQVPLAASRAPIDWGAWGSRGSLLLQVPVCYDNFRCYLTHSYSFGSRLALSLPSGWTDGSTMIVDINPYAARFDSNPHLRGTWHASRPTKLVLERFIRTEKAGLKHGIHYLEGGSRSDFVATDPYGATSVNLFGTDYRGIKSYFVNTAAVERGLWR
ncbi:hypothetical protein L226DRAFT_613193 [Lentinus tigrinus ALCF2SS1-7]|uniref:uncharacterized protein n=1 Tax=Lentinus tigrinus ALCF2SS1-7 TaxID=1328758 RepID=UPI001165CFA7|nr:hypothetical protein L226DRAFT_613193 [Lentinus tigrinus ALCF2SS1-7]